MNCYNMCVYSFFSKPITTPFTISYDSAVPVSTKIPTMLHDGIRKRSNTFVLVDIKEKNMMLSHYMKKMRISGYAYDYRREILAGILLRMKQFEEQIRNGQKLRNRNRAEIQLQKSKREGSGANNWFMKGQMRVLIMVQYIKRSCLRDYIRGLEICLAQRED